MKTKENKVRILWMALLAIIFVLPSSLYGQKTKVFKPYWKRVKSYQLKPQQVAQYKKIIKNFPELRLKNNRLSATANHSLYVNNGAILVVGSGNASSPGIAHRTLTKAPYLRDWIADKTPHSVLLRYLCKCSEPGGGCRVNTQDLSCINDSCINCLDEVAIGDLGNGTLVVLNE